MKNISIFLCVSYLFCAHNLLAQQNNKLNLFAGQADAGRQDGHALDLAQFEQPMGIIARPETGLYIADLKNTAVRQVKDAQVRTYKESGCPTTDIATDVSGNLYLVQTQCHRIVRMTTDGVMETIAGTSLPGVSPDGSVASESPVFSPLGIAWNNGRVYFSEQASQSIRYIDEQGVLHTVQVEPETAHVLPLSTPKAIAFAPDGSMYVADPGTNRVQKIDKDGLMTTYAGDGFGCPKEEERLEDIRLHTPVDVAIAPDGKIYIAEVSRTHPLIETDPVTGQVKRIELGAYIDYSIGEIYPGGLAVDNENTVYLTGQNTHQVYSYIPQAESRTLVHEDITKLEIKVNPNPAYQNFVVRIEPPLSGFGVLQVVNTQGQFMLERKLVAGAQQEEVNLPLLHSGSYQVIVKSGGQRANAPVILQARD